LTARLRRKAPNANAIRKLLPTGHGPKEKEKYTNGHERERGAREKLRYSIKALTAPGLHKSD
jgi:hypothetical protein